MKSVDEIKEMKGKEKISMLTCYDFSMAKLIDGAVDMILIGDSLGMVMLGYKDTKSVTVQDMVRATEAVSRAVSSSMIVTDMPINSYDTKENGLENAKRFIDAGAGAVKLEGNYPEIVKYLVENGIHVQGHIGYLPQTENKPTVHGKDDDDSKRLIEEARLLTDAGIFSLVFELIPSKLAEEITSSISIPTIGIGSGAKCDGQVLVIHDIIGFYKEIRPRFVKKYGDVGDEVRKAAEKYNEEVKNGEFPVEDANR
ncbi:3-methyl-2-oxobutanoate hydroxymethyltransferase [Nanoarchaeota archaeon]